MRMGARCWRKVGIKLDADIMLDLLKTATLETEGMVGGGKKSFSHLGVNLLIDRPAQAIASPAMYALYHLMESMPTQMS